MTDIEKALVCYDGDNSKPYCDLVFKALKELQKREKNELKSTCKHENTKEKKYIDYDRNCYEITCLDCGSILFDGNRYELEEYKREHDYPPKEDL